MTIWTALRFLIASLAFFFIAGVAAAQTESSPLDELLKSASESGAQVIVINPDGTLAGDTEAPEDSFEGSLLMKSQERAVAFRTTLRNRIARAPEAFEEIIFRLSS